MDSTWTSAISYSDGKAEGGGEKEMLVFRDSIAYGAQNSYEKWYIAPCSTVADESTPKPSHIGLGLDTSAPKEEHGGNCNKDADDRTVDANAQVSTELPEKDESSRKEGADSRSLNGKSDIAWGISRGEFSALDIFSKLRQEKNRWAAYR